MMVIVLWRERDWRAQLFARAGVRRRSHFARRE